MAILNANSIIGIIATISTLVCSIAILKSYMILRLKTIILYFFGFFLLGFAVIALTMGTLPLEENLVKIVQSVTFSLAWCGIYLLYFAIKLSKGELYRLITNILSGLIGAIIILYVDGSYYNITWDPELGLWIMHFHPLLMSIISLLMCAIIYELVTFSKRLFSHSRNVIVRNNLRLFFAGWIVTAFCAVPLVLSLMIEILPLYTFLVVLSLGFILISISIYRFPSSLIASTIKTYAIGFIRRESGTLMHHYDFTSQSEINKPLLLSGLMHAVDITLKESVVGCRYLKTIDAGPRKIVIVRGFQTQAIMIVQQSIKLYEDILKRLLILFELRFHNKLLEWDGNVSEFSKFNKVIEKYMAFAM